MKKTPISGNGGRVQEWVASVTLRDSSFEEGVLGILGSSDFVTRLIDDRYKQWLSRLSLAECSGISVILNEKELGVLQSERFPFFLGDCVRVGISVQSAVLGVLRTLRGGVEEGKAIDEMLGKSINLKWLEGWETKDRWEMFLRIARAMSESDNSTFYVILCQMWQLLPMDCVPRSQAILNLLPIAALPKILNMVKSVVQSDQDDHSLTLITPNDLLRLQLAAISGDKEAVRSIGPVTASYKAALIRTALSDTVNGPHLSTVIGGILRLQMRESKKILQGMCAVNFSLFADFFWKFQKTEKTLQYLTAELPQVVDHLLSFWEAQLITGGEKAIENCSNAIKSTASGRLFWNKYLGKTPPKLTSIFNCIYETDIQKPLIEQQPHINPQALEQTTTLDAADLSPEYSDDEYIAQKQQPIPSSLRPVFKDEANHAPHSNKLVQLLRNMKQGK